MNKKKRLGSGIEELVKNDSGSLKLGLISTKKNGTADCIQSQPREIKEIIDRLIGIEQRFDLLLELVGGYIRENKKIRKLGN